MNGSDGEALRERDSFAHFGRDVSEEKARAILAGPDMGRYAKATEHPYDAGVRRAALKEAEELFGEEIRKGLAWLDKVAADVPEIAAAVEASRRVQG